MKTISYLHIATVGTSSHIQPTISSIHLNNTGRNTVVFSSEIKHFQEVGRAENDK